MPSEHRRLIFNREELITAIGQIYQGAPDQLPPGRITECTLVPDPEAIVRLEVFDPATKQTNSVDLAPAFVAAALLRYCMTYRIPIPRNSRKSIHVDTDSVSLHIEIGAGRRAAVSESATDAE